MTPISVWNKSHLSFSTRLGPRHRPPGKDGFTLLEVMIAISLLAIALTTLFGSQSQSVSLGGTVKFNTQAPLLAQLKLAEFSTNVERPSSDSGDFGDDFPGYQWKMETEDVTLETSEILSKLADTLQLLTLTISWGNDHYVYQIQSYLPKNRAF
ncbi:MAG: prepilin-type N-terminal cleavage/methylation domain-containing protein [Desulfocapsaceae bacterium]|nr:prepilin-type N-terminal cleavage/methylation domain-containing protein [Desulfocapsaceae bacterium]